MNKISALLIDDEVSALRTLKGMLGEYFPDIHIIATAQTVKQALNKVALHDPDLIFLDIEMPPFGSGFGFLEQCQSTRFGVIFTTAYPKYAIKAINMAQPWAYLVKPFSIDELKKAIDIAIEKIDSSMLGITANQKSIIIADARKGNIIVRLNQLLYCKADGATVDIVYKKNNKNTTITASRTLKDLEKELPENSFCRCHHSYIVNLAHIERFEQTGRNGLIYLNNEMTVPVSVSKMDFFIERFRKYIDPKTGL